MKKLFTFISLVLVLGFSGCKQADEKLEDRLDGLWNITHYENVKIFNDGTVEVVAETDNAGYFNFYRDYLDLTVFDFEYTANGSTNSGTGLYYSIDDHAQRFIIINGNCVIGCDISYTIEENKKNRQVWSTYDLEQQGLSTDFVYKQTFVLER
jgi:hypothetical protein